MAWDTPSVNRPQRGTALAAPSGYKAPPARISFGRVLWVIACAGAVGVLFGWVASLALASLHGASPQHHGMDRVIALGVGVLAAMIFLWRAAKSDSPGGLPRWVRDRADRRSDGGSGGYNSYDDVGYGVGYASTPGEAAVVVAVEVVADIITSL